MPRYLLAGLAGAVVVFAAATMTVAAKSDPQTTPCAARSAKSGSVQTAGSCPAGCTLVKETADTYVCRCP